MSQENENKEKNSLNQEDKKAAEAVNVEKKNANAKVSQKQQARLQKREKSAANIEKIKQASPEQLRKQLSNKNVDYIFRLEKALNNNEGLPSEKVTETIDIILPEIVIAQYKGVPAATLYHQSPIQKAKELAHPKAKPIKQKFWMQAVDNVLLYLTFFLGMFGLVQLFTPQKSLQGGQTLGILTLISVAVLFGIIMAYYNNILVQPKDERPAIWKLILGGIGVLIVIFAWITLTSLPALRVINPVINPWVEIVLAVIAFLGRRYFKQKYHVIDPLRQRAVNNAKNK
ncbi:DUF1129 domain-containing protein [Lactobacillus sp. PV037]|uniref:DUF1129 family protein n=1 Tax=Lactobacillus sp. PV037 TaxID=2594496 RepID=UPI0022406BEF|nr:DUF1129 family protein [Lactobacillus sp. PV037]QNQ83074.1 DUF1129 domain-containing protein [Lactobacillus sp. PV037]